jgi:starch synthase
VSETYAREIQTPEYGERLDPLLRDRAERLFGIRNGIDTEAYDPATDRQIAARYSADALSERAANKAALQRMGGLAVEAGAPLVGMVSRLTDAKGFDLLTGILDLAMANLPVQFYILGVGEPRYHDLLNDYARRYPGRIAVQLTFNEVSERRIYAGSDIFMMPSQVEPSGLGQMLAMRYGSVPLVRATGGLADTVRDLSTPAGNGVVFQRYDEMALYTALVRAVELARHTEVWRPLQQRAMAADLGWAAPAARYVEIYRWAAAHRLHSAERPLP